MSIARNIRLARQPQLQLRVDMFNAPNQAIVTELVYDRELRKSGGSRGDHQPAF